MVKVLVIGLDGASWRFLKPWIQEGKLPNFKKIMENGCYATLKSVIPPVTCPAWKCYSTGRNPGKLGVFWWVNFDRKTGRPKIPNAYSFKSKDLWDYLGEEDHEVGIINMPTTYPPKKVNGFMVSGFGAPLERRPDYEKNFTYPPGLQEELERKYDYKADIRLLRVRNEKKTVEEVTELCKMRFALLRDKIKEGKYDFLHLTLFHINSLQHFFGLNNLVKGIWRLIDEEIGRLAEQGFDIFIISDHGMWEIRASFAINDWLTTEGYLKLKKKRDERRRRTKTFLHKIYAYARKMDFVVKTAVRTLPEDFILKKIVSGLSTGSEPLKNIGEWADWKKSEVIALSQGPIYINRENVKDYEKMREELAKKLNGVKDQKTGKKIIAKVLMKEEVYEGNFLEDAPDLLVLPNENYEIYGGLVGDGFVYQRQQRGWTSGNCPDGILICFGPNIARKGLLKKASILDIAPTILHMFGIPIPEDMDGRPLKEIFRRHSSMSKRKIKYRSAEKERIKEMIKKMKKSGRI